MKLLKVSCRKCAHHWLATQATIDRQWPCPFCGSKRIHVPKGQ